MSAQSPQHDSRQLFERAVALTRMMVLAARAADWKRVSDLEEQRRAVVLEGAAGESLAWPGEAIAEVLALNQQVLSIATRDKGEHQRQLRELARGKQAKAAYRGLDT